MLYLSSDLGLRSADLIDICGIGETAFSPIPIMFSIRLRTITQNAAHVYSVCLLQLLLFKSVFNFRLWYKVKNCVLSRNFLLCIKIRLHRMCSLFFGPLLHNIHWPTRPICRLFSELKTSILILQNCKYYNLDHLNRNRTKGSYRKIHTFRLLPNWYGTQSTFTGEN